MKARKIIELNKEGRSILVSLWPDDKVISCLIDEEAKKCESGACDEKTFDEYIEHLKSRGYEASEIEIDELDIGESLPKFLADREEVTLTDEGEAHD